MTRAAGRILDAAERALNAFNAADSARDAADARVHATEQQALAVAVNCDNFNCGDNDLLEYFDGAEDALARTFEANAALSAANASYVEAVGIAGAADAPRARRALPALRQPRARPRWRQQQHGLAAKRTDPRIQR